MNAPPLYAERDRYNLMMSEREFRDKTLVSFYVQSNVTPVKKFAPVDIGGYSKRLNLETGDITNYDLELVKLSHRASISRTQILLDMLLEMNKWDFDWFCTFTFDPERVDRYDYQATLDCYINYVHDLSRRFPNLRYITVPEPHRDGGYHFHTLLGGMTPHELRFVDSGTVLCSWSKVFNKKTRKYNYGVPIKRENFERTKGDRELKITDGLPVYNITSFQYGLTTASRIANVEACKFYVSKYIKKNLGSGLELFSKRFFYSRNLAMPSIMKKILTNEVPCEFIGDEMQPVDIERIMEVWTHDYYGAELARKKNKTFNTLQLWLDNDVKAKLILQKMEGGTII